MSSIIHFFNIKSTNTRKIYEALTTQAGLQGWWTTKALAFPKVGTQLRFDFTETDYLEFIITELRENEFVEWEFTSGNNEWAGTKISFEIIPTDGSTNLRFKHYNWQKQTDHVAECNYHWGLYMKSLKTLIETGEGNPYKSN